MPVLAVLWLAEGSAAAQAFPQHPQGPGNEQQADRLSRIIDNLLDVSRIRGGRLQLDAEVFDLGELAREVVSRFQEPARAVGSSLATEVGGRVIGYFDRLKLDQVLVEVMTDKATVELPSPRAGVVKKINFKAGDICPVGKILVTIDDGNAASTSAPPPSHGGHAPVAHQNAPVAHQNAPVAHQNAPVAAKSSGGGQQIEVVDATASRERVPGSSLMMNSPGWAFSVKTVDIACLSRVPAST